jgi:Flp pilus assembly protein TadB
MTRILCQIIGGAFCFFGVIGMLTPIPFGIIFFVIGLMFLIPTTPSVVRGVRHIRRKSEIFDRTMDKITRKLPAPYRRVLRRTEIGAFDF